MTTLVSPCFLAPDLKRLFTSRLLYYDIALFIGFLALVEPLKEIVRCLSGYSGLGTVCSVVLALSPTLVLTVFDLRAKVQYWLSVPRQVSLTARGLHSPDTTDFPRSTAIQGRRSG